MADTLKKVIIYTDGGCDPNPGKGGYAGVLTYNGKSREISGGFRLTTNNRMELYGAIRSLECLKEKCRILLYSDSQYMVRAMEKGSAQKWKAHGFRRRKGKLIPNADLWERLLTLCDNHEVEFYWVRGHDGNVINERCDTLASAAICASDLAIDETYESLITADKGKNFPFGTLLPDDSESDCLPAPISSNLPGSKTITQEGQPCRKCMVPVIKRTPSKMPKPGQNYYFEYYLYCPGCHTMYMVDAAKRAISS